jgi:hypothetical protein
MGFRKSAGGIEKKGKTDTKVFPNDGKHIVDKGPKKYSSSLNKDMKIMGRNLARAKNQKAGRGR